MYYFKGIVLIALILQTTSANRLKRSSCKPCSCTDVYMDCSGLNLYDIPQINQRDVNGISIVDLSDSKLSQIDISLLLTYPILKYINVYDNPNLCGFICTSKDVEYLRIKGDITIETDCMCLDMDSYKTTESVYIKNPTTVYMNDPTTDPIDPTDYPCV